MDGCCQPDFLPCFPYVFQCTALFLLCGYHAHFCVIDGVVCTADDNERPDGKLFEFNLAPVSVLFMSYIISFAMMACSRVIVKTFFEALNFDGTHSANVFIYGAKEAGVNIAKALRVNLRNHYRLRGFIADEPELINKVMMGVKVFPNDDTLIDVLNDRDVQTIIISPAKMEELKKSDMADRLLVHNIKLMTAPP